MLKKETNGIFLLCHIIGPKLYLVHLNEQINL